MRTATLYRLKPRFVEVLQPAVKALARRKISPHAVTVAAIPTSLLLALCLIAGQRSRAFWLAVPVIALLLMAINAIDGSLARLGTQRSAIGRCVNELIDRFADVVIVGSGLFLVSPVLAGLSLSIVLMAEIVALIGWVSTHDRSLVGWLGKPDRALIFSTGAVAGFFFGSAALKATFVLVVMGGSITVGQRIRYVLSTARRLDEETDRGR